MKKEMREKINYNFVNNYLQKNSFVNEIFKKVMSNEQTECLITAWMAL